MNMKMIRWISAMLVLLMICGCAVEEDAQAIVYDLSNLENFMEVSVWFDQNLEEAAAAIGLTDYAEVNMESPRQYSNEYLTIAASATIEYIGLTGGEYTIFGVACGMDRETALNKMVEAGMSVLRDDAAMIVVEHPAAEDSFIDIEGFDSCINLEINNGVVTRMDWSGYTG